MKRKDNYKIYRNNKTVVFDIIYDVIQRAPVPTDWSILFGFDDPEAEAEYRKKLDEYLEKEAPIIKEKFKQLGFKIVEEE